MLNPTLTLVIVVLIPLLFMGIGILHTRRKKTTLEDYISARGSLGLVVGTATLLATVMGAWILFGPAETATNAGAPGGIVGLIGYAVGSAAPLLAFVIIGGRLRRLMPEGHSLTEYVWYRFGGTMYVLTLSVMIFYMFVFLGAELTGIALAVHAIAGTPLVSTVVVVGVATLAYTAYGGLRATIFTDTVQFTLIPPLLLVAFIGGVVTMGGFGEITRNVTAAAPKVLSFGHGLGWETGVALVIAVLAANMFHQGYWQRVYACRDESTLRRSFLLAALVVVPIVFIAGFFGIMAVGAGVAEDPSIALFLVLEEIMPSWLILSVLVLAMALVMSSVDSLLNGLVSSFTSDLHRMKPELSTQKLLWWARGVTVIVAGAAMAVATQAYSVLYLFLVADLVAAAGAVPIFLGLYLRMYNARIAVVSVAVGLVAGVIFFPTPDFVGWLDIPKAGSLMVSFLAAFLGSALVAGALSALCAWRKWGHEYDFDQLRRMVRVFQAKV